MIERWTYSTTRAPSGQVVVVYDLVDVSAPPGVPWWPTRRACKSARKYLSDHPAHPLPKGLQPGGTT